MMKFIYLDLLGSPAHKTELRYSVNTLLAEAPEAAGNIVIYTDAPEEYAPDAACVTAVDVSRDIDAMTNGRAYLFRAKPCVLLRALRGFDCPCVFLDTDTFVRRGFARSVKRKLAEGAVMDRFLRRRPFPECVGFAMTLPSGIAYRYDPETAVIYNSGVIGVRPEHAPAIGDAIALIDAIRPLSHERTHDQEQFAINAALLAHGLTIHAIHKELTHYCQRWAKRYMHVRFDGMPFVKAPIHPMRPCIWLNPAIRETYKAYSLARWRLGL